MSLLLNASEWKNDDTTSSTPVRRQRNNASSSDNTQSSKEGFQELNPASVEYQQNVMEKRSQRVNDLLNKLNVENDGDKLANFNPPPKPIINKKNGEINVIKPDELMPKHPTQEIIPDIPKNKKGLYVPNDLGKNYSNYGKSYDPTLTQNKPYYANMGIMNGQGSLDSKLIEKINYMIHLLEEQQDEKTNNVTEEFVLYSLFGVFIIFVLDSFARSGKYVR